MSTTVEITPEIGTVLRQARVENNIVYLPPGQLERNLYVGVDKTLKALGGKWDRRQGGHVFPQTVHAQAKLVEALGTGRAVDKAKAAGFFETPMKLALHLVRLADVDREHTVLEPSAGHGAIADELNQVVPRQRLFLVELLPENTAVLRGKGYAAVEEIDFLDYRPITLFDRVVMNPPFEFEIEHVQHAFNLLVSGGRLVSVMSNAITFRTNVKHRVMRNWIKEYGGWETNPDGAFKGSGTGVHTINVVLDKP